MGGHPAPPMARQAHAMPYSAPPMFPRPSYDSSHALSSAPFAYKRPRHALLSIRFLNVLKPFRLKLHHFPHLSPGRLETSGRIGRREDR